MENFILTKEPYQSFRQALKNLIEKEVAPNALKWEKEAYFPRHLLKEFGGNGYLGLSLPLHDGGMGKDFWHEVIFVEELALCQAIGWVISILVQSNMIAPLFSLYGSLEQKEKILKPALRGEFYLAMAATEKECGSDLASIKTQAVPHQDSFFIQGTKRYITNGSVAGYIIIFAKIIGEKNNHSYGLFIIPSDTNGVKRERMNTTGLKTGDTALIYLDNCKIPKQNMIGDPQKSFSYLHVALQRERLLGAIALNALSLYAWEKTLTFLKNRKLFGESLSKKQIIRHRMAELKTSLEASKHFAYTICDAYMKGKNVDKEILMLKIMCYENCQNILKNCLHLHGGEGFLQDHWLAHLYQDSHAFTLAGGTSEVIRDLLSEMLEF